ncbi:class I SAM-dependent RNA methyltransferase [Corynebacterium lizhenjunii]|uniref:Class I SAM-dependent RNA methyltransferase n=1 Tax=Corynebacterium lizhenjunii TaxID=2709394 RepID=A0A7T0PC97_9CORY|nr:TRAM domain-containing protein [Corynebacterium lizhenjunii]QPK80340.1 class I SAM-dependent RNA methyltransferase [Corynebacterium lizhenjunii]
MSKSVPAKGDVLELAVESMAHGGEAIAHAADGRVVFVRGALPDDRVLAQITRVKKAFLRAQVIELVQASPLRVESACPAAAAGAGCCDFAVLDPGAELDIKADILTDQLRRLGGMKKLPQPELIELAPHRGWRTRVRLGVDAQGRAGLRRQGSHELVTDVECTQLYPGLVSGLMGPDARRFTPGAEVIAVMDATRTRHVVESRRAPRGRRVEYITEVIEGSGTVVEHCGEQSFEFPATGFWQAHVKAPEVYSQLIETWLATVLCESAYAARGTAWDLYGGVGVFAPALARAFQTASAGRVSQGTDVEHTICSVDYSPSANTSTLLVGDLNVEFYNATVEAALPQLPAPDVVVLDPPRAGAGQEVVEGIAQAKPHAVVHVGCDPATFARDLASWSGCGYEIHKWAVVNAFPGTHHMEALALLVPCNSGTGE